MMFHRFVWVGFSVDGTLFRRLFLGMFPNLCIRHYSIGAEWRRIRRYQFIFIIVYLSFVIIIVNLLPLKVGRQEDGR
jgi:hypothetical protein